MSLPRYRQCPDCHSDFIPDQHKTRARRYSARVDQCLNRRFVKVSLNLIQIPGMPRHISPAQSDPIRPDKIQRVRHSGHWQGVKPENLHHQSFPSKSGPSDGLSFGPSVTLRAIT
jgi:hypothetical protein